MASAWLNAETTSRVRQPTAPGPAPASQTWPRSNCGSCADSRASCSSRLMAYLNLVVTERTRPPIAHRMSEETPHLRRGWTTGACSAGAAKAACAALLAGGFPDAVEIGLPGGKRAGFALAEWELGEGFARAGVVMDAGDDPDVTHGALLRVTVRRGAAGAGVTFKA